MPVHPPRSNRLISLLKPYYGLVLLLIALTVFSNGLNLVLPRFIQVAIDAVVQDKFVISQHLLPFLWVSLLIFFLASAQNLIQVYASERVAFDLRQKLSLAVSIQSYPELQKITPSKLLTHLTSDIDAIKVFVSMAISSLVSSLLLIVGASGLLLSLHWQLGLAILALIPLIVLVFYLVFSKVRHLFRKSQEIIDRLNRVIREGIVGAPQIRVLHAEVTSTARFDLASDAARNNSLRILRLFASLIPVISFISGLGSLIILLLGGHFAILGSLSLGKLAAFNAYLAMLIFPIMLLGFMSNLIARSSASYARISSLLNSSQEQRSDLEQPELRGALAVRDLSFSHSGRQILNPLSFDLPAGSRTAILGPTAAGKSTLLALLTGLFLPESGEVLYDGIPLQKIEPGTLYPQVGMVFQDSALFNMSLRENIAFSRQVSEQELQKAIETAELTQLISSLPQGLETQVSERGLNLSGGQKQRMILARALAQNPRILLLDDFTARVDARTEELILGNLKRNYPELTLVSITQKIEPIQNYDQILLMMEGQLLAQGTHAELMRSSSEYMQIYQSQRSTQTFEMEGGASTTPA
ncbi:ABC transporter ATP-binding protein [bacterium (Candidatus Blackallbacteria) CG17_big_fil_post_rev_8_21_14_2_50_48_46]|uniref:ABC transporter ATP-binding protein n=1 Tax=bacterium (Candidatus Blackallbacteria) CG17_big_fil_post_rev_8_21_14_2_50_48_46 TaxID=2014261 RepID=A0A2M7G384_9BACT|nr:MAG: ABC transporter ATP-binding protein [bacterium (Candidatus Blackallbacteria) CG18_big_fil_WC_8_21_14_2_50_49_26]PIW16295.1 MAG: ABC transporter ATP-binding protein [bacterium (Candidatus Blackallbacteria) CG17_big_fil_post_rev_8_21_14_2_50_48_46]PIW45309.1 MAG: ABC transporter ATP-binding protein [bacterium (Candidatus Blackallbacteria) CG13_big_fil_rev_8_21_14_2_50_49_14]